MLLNKADQGIDEDDDADCDCIGSVARVERNGSTEKQDNKEGILELYEKTEPCDITTVSNILLKDDKLTKLGGRVFLVELVESVAATANAKHYADIVLEKYLLRRTIEITNEISRSCYNLDQPVSDLLDQFQIRSYKIR